ncbi:hypothetical protein ACWC09_16095 [Streptomyces sp. NPDC001617]
MQRAEDALDAPERRTAPADATVAERALQSMDFAPPPGKVVDDAAVLTRLATVEAALEQLRRAAAEPFSVKFSVLRHGQPTAAVSRLRKVNSDLRRTLALYEEAIRQLAIENDALRSGGTVLPLPSRSRPAPPGPS